MKAWLILVYRLQVHVALEIGGHVSSFFETAQGSRQSLEVGDSNGERVYMLCAR